MRVERQQFMEAIDQFDPVFPYVVFSAQRHERQQYSYCNTVSVILSMRWPTSKDKRRNVFASIEKTSATAEIFRVKDYLERRLAEPLCLLDVRLGCVKVRYGLPDSVNREVVRDALIALDNDRDFFSIVHVSANVQNRAVKIR